MSSAWVLLALSTQAAQGRGQSGSYQSAVLSRRTCPAPGRLVGAAAMNAEQAPGWASGPKADRWRPCICAPEQSLCCSPVGSLNHIFSPAGRRRVWPGAGLSGQVVAGRSAP